MHYTRIWITLSLLVVSSLELPFQESTFEINQEAKHLTKYEATFRLPNDTVPIHYTIDLIPYIVKDNFTFDGMTSIIFKVVKPTEKVVLHALNLTLDEEYTKLEHNGTLIKPIEHYYHHGFELLQIFFKDVLNLGVYTIHFKYRGLLHSDRQGFYNTSYVDDDGTRIYLAATHFESTNARRAFPCWDEIGLKATFNISIKHDANYTALSNMPAYERSFDKSDGKVWTKFETTPIMSTYVLAFVVSDFVRISNEDQTINVWCRKNAVDSILGSHDFIQRATVVLEQYMNKSIAVPKTDHIAIPKAGARATEHWGLITYVEDAILYNSSKDSIDIKLQNEFTAVHELVHQWFGNLVTPAWWNHLWLSEGFSAYFQFYLFDKIQHEGRTMDYFKISVLQSLLLRSDSYKAYPVAPTANNNGEIKSIFNLVTYRKAPCLIHMLSNIMSEKVFHNGLLTYLDKYQYKSTTADDLWEVLQDTIELSDIPHNNLNIKEVMDPWINLGGYPTISVRRDYKNGNVIISQTVEPILSSYEYLFTYKYKKRMNEYKWFVPINYATQSDMNFNNTLTSHWLKPEDNNLTINDIDPNDWIIINVQQTGYYRVNYDLTNWRRIAKYLNSKNYTNIHYLNRAQIIDDAFALLSKKLLSTSIFLDITNYLAREDDFIPWASVSKFFRSFYQYLCMPNIGIPLKQHVIGLLNKVVTKILSINPSDVKDQDKTIIEEILTMACIAGHRQCRNSATAELLGYLEDPEINKISHFSKSKAFCFGLLDGNETIWNKILDIYMEKFNSNYLDFLACTENENLIEHLLDIAMLNSTFSIPKEHYYKIINAIYFNEISHTNTLINYIEEHYEGFAERHSNMKYLIETTMQYSITFDQLNKTKELMSRNTSDLSSVDIIIERMEKEIGFYNSTASDIQKWFDNSEKNFQSSSSHIDNSLNNLAA